MPLWVRLASRPSQLDGGDTRGAGEPFDTVTGLPDSLRDGRRCCRSSTWWSGTRTSGGRRRLPKQRDSMTDALATVVPALVKPGRGRPTPEILRRALRSYVLPVPRRERERPDEVAAAVRWIEKASLPVGELQEIVRVHELIDALSRRLDGRPAARRRTGDVAQSSSTLWSMRLSLNICRPIR